jgi:hypothetical protein
MSRLPILTALILSLTAARASDTGAQRAIGASVAARPAFANRAADPPSVARPVLAPPPRTAKYVGVGAGVGAALGVGVGAISMRAHPPNSEDPFGAGTSVVLLGLFGAGVGALAGWLAAVITR